ncbi:MAG: type III-B CRISPR-associated protein Cas10/Cmr2, partial [Thermoprotei archaeon]
VLGRVKRILDSLRVPVTISYHVSISSALMRIALLDVAVISKLDGFVVYAGGDDLLAFMPVDRALEAVYVTRRSFAGSNIDEGHVKFIDGFIKLRSALLPMLPGLGRSYCVYIAHYHYPLSTALSRSQELVEEAKDRLLTKYYRVRINGSYSLEVSGKDFLVIAYNPRGGERWTALPLTWIRLDHMNIMKDIYVSTVGELAASADEILKGMRPHRALNEPALTRSLLYDVEECKDLLVNCFKVLKDRSEKTPIIAELVCNTFKRLFERNYSKKSYDEHLKNIYMRSVGSLIVDSKLAHKVEPCEGLPGVLRKDLIGLGLIGEDKERETTPILISLLRAVRLVYGGMR